MHWQIMKRLAAMLYQKEVVLMNIAPIYNRIAETQLLEKCLKGQMQNANESLHSFIWRKCDKAHNNLPYFSLPLICL